MCTVSWIHQSGGYHLLCNRDEKRTRGRAFAPRLAERGGVRYIAPVDSDRGGTWLSANELGVSVCLLNANGQGGGRSRGLLVQELAWAPSAQECALWLKHLDLRVYAPFTVVILQPRRSAILAAWNGRELDVDPAGDRHMPLTSSSYDSDGVRRARLCEFARFGTANLYAFHSSHGSAPDAYSPCMHRPDAETVSFSWIAVTAHEVRFLYLPAAPCQCVPSEQQILTRAA